MTPICFLIFLWTGKECHYCKTGIRGRFTMALNQLDEYFATPTKTK